MNNPNEQQMNIDFSQTTAEVCEKCKNDTFQHVFKIRKLSALLSPSGEEMIIPVQTFACTKCSNINVGFRHKDNPDF